jgi:hypothetical protein
VQSFERKIKEIFFRRDLSMKKLDDISEDRFRVLVMKAVDGDLSESEKVIFKSLITQNPIYNKEWQDFKKLKNITDKVELIEPVQEEWDMYWSNVYNRIERGLAWLLLSSGAIIILGYGAFKFIEALFPAPNIHIIIKVGIFLLLGGLSALAFSIIREKIFIYKSDPYKEIKR